MTTTAIDSARRAASPAALLAGLRADRAAADAAEARILAGAVAWAEAHPARSAVDAAAHWEHGIGVPLAGEGTPLVAEWCVAELAAALGLTTDAGRHLLGHALELRHRLPRVWERVQTGDLQAWRARRIADHTITLSVDAADYVDRHVASVAHKIGPAQTQRLVDEAIARIDPDSVVETAETSADRRHVHDHQISFNGTMRVEADLDIADALDLDAALSERAAVLKDLGCGESLDVRRSLALGDLARTQLGLNSPPVRHAASQPEHVRWCSTSTRVGAARTRRPIASACGRFGVGRPHPTAWHRTRNARACDLDHIKPYERGGPTATDNLAPLCRRHHRLKTHAGWTYTMLEPGTYLWRSPHGLAYQRDHTGTTPLE